MGLSIAKVPSEARRKGAVRYVNYCLWRSAVLLASTWGGWNRAAMTERGRMASQLNIVPVSSNFPVP